jgi:MoxR-like ATPase
MDYTPKFFKLPKNGIWSGNTSFPFPYLFADEIAIAVDVALATNRPLLVSGPPGSGKSTLAQAVAGLHDWSYLKHTLTSRSRLEDLTGEIDQLQRLHDAQAVAATRKELLPDWAYQKPGLFWWGFNPESAKNRGRTRSEISPLSDRFIELPYPGHQGKNHGVVILLDEIDKAEPDIPNDLLDPLDQRRFRPPIGDDVIAEEGLSVFVIITTNGERELPPAFLRRCAFLELQSPDVESMVSIAAHHFPKQSKTHAALFATVADRFLRVQDDAVQLEHRPPGTSEFLDAVRACIELNKTPEHPIWQQIELATLKKEPE